MTLKDINFSVDMYGTSAITTNTYQTVFTGDEDSVQLNFAISDEADLTGATALIHLYFGDSSHFERTCIPITGGFKYTLTGTENDHAGVTRVDIYITKAGSKFTRAGYKFRIDKSLEASAPLVEYAVDTVDTVVKEAGDWLIQAQTDFGTAQDTRAAEWVTDNDTRADEFTAAQTSRATTFGESEASRASTFNTNETGRSNTFTTNENARQAATEANQAQAATDHTTAEADHDIAIADSSMASSDHATATTDHSTAVTDHSTASADHAAAIADQEIVDGLQDQFDDVIANATVDSEVINARQGSTTLSQNLLSIKSVLADTLNKSAITLTHMFADNTARDAYFVAHPTELVDLQFIKVGTGYQQYIEGVWQASTAIVAEQLSATNQPIVDTGNYFTTDNTNAALQEMGAHKASTANPHATTKAQVGLTNVDNTSDANKPVSTAMQTALNLKANKVQEAWITPTLLNGWVEHLVGSALKFKKTEFGEVQIIGSVKSGTIPSTVFTLPVGYRPLYNLYFPLSLNDKYASCHVWSNGEVRILNGDNTWASLSNIKFIV